MAFNVDTAGRVEPDSIVFLQAGYREYAERALRMLRSARFAPAHVGRCPVRARTQMAIVFDASSGP